MSKINRNQLMYLIPDEEIVKYNDPIYSKYLGWAELEKADEEQLVLIGKFDNEGGPTSNMPYRDKYWQADAPIALAWYPFFGCHIYRYGQDGGLYFVYNEFGGHAPERRCRLIQRHLISTEIPG
ncbi:hypothetical protein [Chitinophaga silvisoli]|nr:hypothetical protein [Chitinophaga silvisoli]